MTKPIRVACHWQIDIETRNALNELKEKTGLNINIIIETAIRLIKEKPELLKEERK